MRPPSPSPGGASAERKQVLIVRGGPGTGKSVVAINLLVELSRHGLLTKYVSKNAAPREVYKQRLGSSFKQVEISSLFGGSGAFVDTPANSFDVLVVDEAHRLNRFSGLYGNLGENQVKELINSAKCTVLFTDDDQMVTLSDIGHTGELRHWANALGADVTEMELSSQFRCHGSDGYLAWLDHTLGIRETADTQAGELLGQCSRRILLRKLEEGADQEAHLRGPANGYLGRV